MQLSSAPAKLTLAFATSGGKNVIPVAINPTPGMASFTEGFPAITRVPVASGGIPPFGLDMNGILFDQSSVARWLNAGGGFVYDATFAADVNVGGYPKGSRLVCADGIGDWLNTTDDNATDPDAGGAGWVPGVRYGSATVPMSNANVTLTALQYRKPVIIITGVLTANVNLIFPTIIGQWLVVNRTTGAFTITCKTAAGSGVIVPLTAPVWGDGTNIALSALDTNFDIRDICCNATGTANAIVGIFPNITPTVYTNGIPFYIRAGAANTISTPTVTFNPGVLSPVTIVKGNNLPLLPGDIAGAGHWLCLQYDTTLGKAVLANPALGISNPPANVAGISSGLVISATGTNSNITISLKEVVVESVAGTFFTLRNLALVKTTAAWVAGTAAGGLDTGTIAVVTWYYVWAIYNPTTNVSDFLISASSTAPTMPSGYTHKGLIGAFFTDATANKYPLSYVQKGDEVQWKVAAGSNLLLLPLLAAGISGDTDVPIWVSVSLSSAVPPIATCVDLLLADQVSGGNRCIAAPNNSYGAYNSTTNSPPLVAANFPQMAKGRFVLEGPGVYWAGNGAQSRLQCVGYKL